MNDFDEVRVQLDAERKLTIELVGAETWIDNQVMIVPAHLVDDFFDEIDRIVGR